MKARRPGRVGRIRIGDHSLKHAGIHKGDLAVVDLMTEPKQDELCAAFTACGELVVRYFHREQNGRIRLSARPGAKGIQIFAPAAVVIFGCVRDIVKASVI